MCNVAATEVNRTARSLTTKLVGFLTTRKLVVAESSRALVGQYNLIMEPLTRDTTLALVAFAEANGTDFGGFLPQLVQLANDFDALPVATEKSVAELVAGFGAYYAVFTVGIEQQILAMQQEVEFTFIKNVNDTANVNHRAAAEIYLAALLQRLALVRRTQQACAATLAGKTSN